MKDNGDDYFDHIWTDVAVLMPIHAEILEDDIIHNEYRHPYTGKITQEEIEVPGAK